MAIFVVMHRAGWADSPASRRPNDLSARLRSLLGADRQQIEETPANKLRQLRERLRAVANDTLRTIEADAGAATARMRVMLLNAWLGPLVIGLSLSLGFSGGSWGLMHRLPTSIQSRIEALATLHVGSSRHAKPWPRSRIRRGA